MRAFISFAQTTKVAKQAGADRQGVVDVIVRQQTLDVQNTLQNRLRPIAVLVQPVLIGVGGQRSRIGEGAGQFTKKFRREQIIVI